MGATMNKKPALVTATAMTLATSAAVSGLFLTIGNSVPAVATPAAQTVTEYVVADPASQPAAQVEVVAQPAPAGTPDPFADFGEYFDDGPSSDTVGESDEAPGTDGATQNG